MTLKTTQFDKIRCLLEEASGHEKSLNWMDQPGDLVFTAPKDIADPKCHYVVMGLNPGGDADVSKQKKLCDTIKSLEPNHGKDADEGNIAGWRRDMKNRYVTIKEVMNHLGFTGEPTGVNLFPYPSFGMREFKIKANECKCTIDAMFESMWPVHEYLLKQTGARVLLTLGYGLKDSVMALLKWHYGVEKFCFDEPGVRAFRMSKTDLQLRYVIGLHHIAWRNVNKESLCKCICKCEIQGLC
ncbi:MAG: hypothetical protein ACYCUX_09715 [Metallibacterium sp.]